MVRELGIAMLTLYAWANEYPEFEEAVEISWHKLHACWINLLRENITNPAFRQTTALQVMAKRFPATWGQQPRNTLEHFEARNASNNDGQQNEEDPRALTDEELAARLEVYRLRQESEK
ncbi:MAG: hypothetical protein CMF72_01710 [Mameliella sp.]|nr:hypothetical protein [Mameliella sp.]|tara:strand:- start:96 stop:452 length:357 start_codon:yes stop_codon:yes gene_type:complete